MHTRKATTPLSGWVTMSDVSDALGIKHNTVRQTVHRALLERQEWVKREPHPTPNDPVRWLIDTSHAIYQYHEHRWQKLAEKTSDQGQWCDTPDTTSQAIDVTETWPELCRWLAEHGLVVFVNSIATDQGWQWSWMDSAGSGYPDATAAITAALQYQLAESTPMYTMPASIAPSAEAELYAEPKRPLWNGLFRWKW